MTTMSGALASGVRGAPDVAAALDAAWDGAWATVDPSMLELCRLQIESILGSDTQPTTRTPAALAAGFDEAKAAALSNWFRSPLFTPTERACLAFTDQFVIDVANLDDATALAVGEHLGEQGLVDFVSALLILEQRQRLSLLWGVLLDDGPPSSRSSGPLPEEL